MMFSSNESTLSRTIRHIHKSKNQQNIFKLALLASLAGATSAPAFAQEDATEGSSWAAIEEIVVQARRRDESLQEVPLTVNVVTAKALEDLNIRKFEDLQGTVAGLTLQEDSIAPSASVRGVRFDTFASGFNPTVEFYLNDAPIVSLAAMQAMFDVGQIEVLRGPQGTLRGRASPSGSITITSRRPELNEFGGYIDTTMTDQSGQNHRAAINIPLVEDKVALRIAGFYEENEGAQIESINSSAESKNRGDGWRVSLRVDPTEDLSFNLMHQKMTPKRWSVPQVESAYLSDPSIAASPTLIKASDRQGVTDIATYSEQTLERTNFEAQWVTGVTQLNYAGSYTEQTIERKSADDAGDYFGPGSDPSLQNFGQELLTETKGFSHEVRLSSAEPLFDGLLDYVVGALYQHNDSPSDLTNQTAVFLPGFLGGGLATVANTPIERTGDSTEKSIFGNLTFNITDNTEFSLGSRYIEYETSSTLAVSGNTLSDSKDKWTETVYSAALKHQFTDDLMGYVSYGSSWRPGVEAVGNFSLAQSPLEESFIKLDPETSDSYEIGIKSSWLDDRLRVNVAAYYQEFENYPYRVGGAGAYFISTDYDANTNSLIQNVDNFNFVAAVPVKVQGVELESTFNITENWSANLLMAWSEGKIDGGTVPCNEPYGGNVPTIGDIQAASGGDNLATCDVDFRSNYAPLLTTTLQSEYNFPIANFEGYVRGLVTRYEDAKNDPSNPLDDIDSYNIVNLYAGIRDQEGIWEIMLYGKNVFETERVLSRGDSQLSTSYTVYTPDLDGPGPGVASSASASGLTPWREISMTAPREFGVNVRYNF